MKKLGFLEANAVLGADWAALVVDPLVDEGLDQVVRLSIVLGRGDILGLILILDKILTEKQLKCPIWL